MPERVFPFETLTHPKAQIAELVRKAGIPVPIIYPDLDTARVAVAQGTQVIMRSDSPDEFDGPSGLRR
ncbi:MAG: hypothetical protein O3B87_00005, partial [bacterium]|nr:hypothetical protein [bacterium]